MIKTKESALLRCSYNLLLCGCRAWNDW